MFNNAEYGGLVLSLFSLTFGSCSVVPDSSSIETSESTISLIILGAICLAFLVVLVLVVMNCGGCDDMSGDVSSENHPACGKQTNNFSPVVGDANTGVLMSSTTMGESASRIPPQNLPFSVQPATAQGLRGYSSAPQASAPVLEPPPPSYQQLCHSGQLYWWRKPEYPEKTTSIPQVTDCIGSCKSNYHMIRTARFFF